MEVKADKELQLKQDPQMVWKVMTDPALMVVSVPGAELTETLDERNFKGKIGIFDIENNKINHKLNFYKVEDGTLTKIF